MAKLAGISLLSFAWPPRFSSEPTVWHTDASPAHPTDFEVHFDTLAARHVRAMDEIFCVSTGERMRVVHTDGTTLTVIRNIG